jgi:hypothetical protein
VGHKSHTLSDLASTERQIAEKFHMAAVMAVVRLAERLLEVFLRQPGIESVK